uniref:ATP synthase complex subunit 8 n=1 Tax=Boulengerella maculata TaxID=42603 RepID=F7IWP0_9TELE|nr:ATPase subunit 8 [Boulengerella maculata]
MPQLNPAPWMAMLMFSWLIFLLVVPQKVLNHITPNNPLQLNTQKPDTTPWTWPWH